jgi:hypothetical protein
MEGGAFKVVGAFAEGSRSDVGITEWSVSRGSAKRNIGSVG